MAAGGGNEVSASMDTSGAFAAKALEDPKTLPLDGDEPLAREANPFLLAKLANPLGAGVPDAVALPKSLPGVCAAAAEPVWPKAGLAAAGEAVAHGDGFCPRPPSCPNADGDPNDGVAVAAAGWLPKLVEANAGATAAAEPVAHGEDLAPRVEAPPKAGAPKGLGLLEGEPKTLVEGEAWAGVPNGFGLAGEAKAEGSELVEAAGWAAASPRPG